MREEPGSATKVEADMQGNGEFDFWVIYQDFWKNSDIFVDFLRYFGKIALL